MKQHLQRHRPKSSCRATKTLPPPLLPQTEVMQFVRDRTSNDPSWQLKINRCGIKVWRRSVPSSAFDEIRGSGVLDVKPAKVIALFESSDVELIRRFNPLYDIGWDVQRYSGCAKVSYARVRSAFPGFKPRDTVTCVSRHSLGLDTVFILHAMQHSKAPPQRGCVRAEIIRGMHLIQVVPLSPTQTNFTFTQQVNAGGAVPAWVANLLTTREAVQFIQRIGDVASSVSSC
eukprot:CAMPEP_0119335262 /NCGR_PEP_ID=MMETSP1333-20130426/89174_1 /TAXON_ID=418940 /ORGANISM="Scyphosphaera apsteinii, Strain RCC1455" /LENGTH=229 /DNA_ID=CAMNT_0007345773 /DNA_START=216 /DNA_END=905 /DNA_ORIENTATION=+